MGLPTATETGAMPDAMPVGLSSREVQGTVAVNTSFHKTAAQQTRVPRGLGYVCGRTARTAAAVTRYRQDLEVFLRRKGFGSAGVVVEDDGDGLRLDMLSELFARPATADSVVVVPTLEHLGDGLPDIASQVTLWTMYPELCWETMEYEPAVAVEHAPAIAAASVVTRRRLSHRLLGYRRPMASSTRRWPRLGLR
jgi:hypothetical protein